MLIFPRFAFVSLFWLLSFVWSQSLAAQTIADYTVAKESVLRAIPSQYIDAAKDDLHILYCGTSHSTQVLVGMRGLMDYKAGDDVLFAFSFDGSPGAGELDIDYGAALGTDLSHDSTDGSGHTDYFTGTVTYLDNNPDCNVVMWSWCSIEGHDVEIYLSNFDELVAMYEAGGSKGRTEENEVTFVWMTGYARGGDGDTPESPYIESPFQNRERIVNHCIANGYFCLDYWTQDCYDYGDDTYNPDESGNTNMMHLAYQDSHALGEDWFQCRSYSDGSVELPAHANNHITGNRRAYAAWWIWARIAGWNGGGSESITVSIPASATEGDGVLSGQGSITLSVPTSGDLTIALSSDDDTELTVPETIIVLDGATSASFDLTIGDDDIVDGVQSSTVIATANGWTSGTDSMDILDNDGVANTPPTVDAGTDQTITLPTDTVALDGTAADPDDTPGTEWTMESGPGVVRFDDASAVDTNAVFPQEGRYVLRLSADDGSNPVVSDTVTITVESENDEDTDDDEVSGGCGCGLGASASDSSSNGLFFLFVLLAMLSRLRPLG